MKLVDDDDDDDDDVDTVAAASENDAQFELYDVHGTLTQLRH